MSDRDTASSPFEGLLGPNLPIPVPEPLPKGMSFPTWVILDLAGRYPARSPANPLQAALLRADSLESLDRKIDALAAAPWLHGVLVRMGPLDVGFGTAEHLRASLRRLSDAKRTVAWTADLDARTLYVACGARELALPESANLNLVGFTMEVTFLGGFLKKHGIAYENVRVREYKSALTTLAQDRMDEFDREQREALLASIEATWVQKVAEARGVAADDVLGWLAEGITSAARAREVGLIDRVAYEDELVGPGTRPYATVARALTPPKARGAGRVAIVSVVGAIVPGKSRNNPVPLPLLGGPQAGSDSVVSALRRAAKDPATRAVVLYVDSPGGSALASDLIWREVERSRKPVVVVMGDVAASGGYYVSAAAKHIVAAPGTVTGSIGVVIGKPVLQEFDERQGLRRERVSRSAFPGLMSLATPWEGRERDLIERGVAEVYERFVARVAKGRGLTPERVNEIARGRIWSGADALGIGLVDELGDLNTGVARACELAGLPYGSPVWSVEPRGRLELPDLREPAALLEGAFAWPFRNEGALLLLDGDWRIR